MPVSAWRIAYCVFVLWLSAGCGGPPGQREWRAGLREFERERWVRARALFEKAIARRPGRADNAIVYHYLGIACWRLGQTAAAIEAFEAARRLEPERFETTYNLAVVYAEGGDAARAEPLFSEAAATKPDDPRPLEYLGSLYAQAGQWAEARRALTAALSRAPNSPRIRNALGCVETRAGRPTEALSYFLQALEKDPRYAPALFNLGAYYRARDRAQAEAYWRRFLEVAEQDPVVRAWPHVEFVRKFLEKALPTPTTETPPAPTYAQLLKQAADEAAAGRRDRALHYCLQAAGRAQQEGDDARQEKALREAVRLAPDRARSHHALARFLLERKRTAEALAAFKKVVDLDPRNGMAQLGLAQAALASGETDAAAIAARAATQYEPDNPEAWWTLATVYDEVLQIPEQAVAAYREFERRFPNDARLAKARQRIQALGVRPATRDRAAPPPPPPTVGQKRQIEFKPPTTRNLREAARLYNRATTHHQEGDLDRAIFFYLRALEQDDTFAQAYFNLGHAYAAKHELDLAVDAYRRAVAAQPDNATFRYNLVLTLMQAGDPGSAVAEAQELLRREPEHAPTHYALGMLYSQNPSTYSLARRHYQTFLRLAPRDPSAEAVKRWLETH